LQEWLTTNSGKYLEELYGRDPAALSRRSIHWPNGRMGENIEVAYAVLFLASDESSLVNGTDFIVDGGLTKVRKFTSNDVRI